MICQVYQGIILSGDPLLVSGFLSVLWQILKSEDHLEVIMLQKRHLSSRFQKAV